MASINKTTSLEELAAIVSQTLEEAGISATLSGGSAVSIYADNQYQSYDLDYVTSASQKELLKTLSPLGFTPSVSARHFEHAETDWLLEFPPSPLGFGELVVDEKEIPSLNTDYGPIKVITPTLCVMDRLSAYWYHKDRQCLDQAIMVCRKQDINWKALSRWAVNEGRDPVEITKLREKSRS